MMFGMSAVQRMAYSIWVIKIVTVFCRKVHFIIIYSGHLQSSTNLNLNLNLKLKAELLGTHTFVSTQVLINEERDSLIYTCMQMRTALHVCVVF